MVAVAPAGTADLSKCPDRADYLAGAAGDAESLDPIRKMRMANETCAQ